MGNSRGFILGIIIGVVVTAGLFLLMQQLIKSSGERPKPVESGPPIDIVREPHKPLSEAERMQPTPPEKEPEPVPPTPQKPTFPEGGGDGFKPGRPYYPIPTPNPLPPGGEPAPIVRLEPTYPRRALQQGLEGDVTLEFTITEEGTVTDIRVVSSTNSIFEREAIRAVQNWRYAPKVVNGQPVAQPNVVVTIEFRLNQEE